MYLNGFGYETSIQLCETFFSQDPTVNDLNCYDKCAQIFKNIIIDAVYTTKRNKNISNELSYKHSCFMSSIERIMNSCKINFTRTCYNLIATVDEIHGVDFIDVPIDNALNVNGIEKHYSELSQEIIKELLTFPALIYDKNKNCIEETDSQHIATFAKLTKIKKETDTVRIYFQPIATFQQYHINEYSTGFGIDITQQLKLPDSTHWLLNKIDLIKQFENTNIQFCTHKLLYISDVAKSDSTTTTIAKTIPEFKAVGVSSYHTLCNDNQTIKLNENNTYRLTITFTFDWDYSKGTQMVKISFLWNDVMFYGFMSPKNWISTSYMNGCIYSGKKKSTAINHTMTILSNNLNLNNGEKL